MTKPNPHLNDQQRIQQVLQSAFIMRIALHDEAVPYIVPVNFGYIEGKIYFHASKTGKKMDLLTVNPNIGFQVDTDVSIMPSEIACKNSVRYKSVIGMGTVSIVEDPEEKRQGLVSITRQIGNNSEEMEQSAVDATAVLRVDIETCTYKQSPVKGN